MLNDDVVIRSLALGVHLVIALVEFFYRLVSGPREVMETCEEALGVVVLVEGADGVALGQRGDDVLGDEGCGEEGHDGENGM